VASLDAAFVSWSVGVANGAHPSEGVFNSGLKHAKTVFAKGRSACESACVPARHKSCNKSTRGRYRCGEHCPARTYDSDLAGVSPNESMCEGMRTARCVRDEQRNADTSQRPAAPTVRT
jgi:hypothetical protein